MPLGASLGSAKWDEAKHQRGAGGKFGRGGSGKKTKPAKKPGYAQQLAQQAQPKPRPKTKAEKTAEQRAKLTQRVAELEARRAVLAGQLDTQTNLKIRDRLQRQIATADQRLVAAKTRLAEFNADHPVPKPRRRVRRRKITRKPVRKGLTVSPQAKLLSALGASGFIRTGR